MLLNGIQRNCFQSLCHALNLDTDLYEATRYRLSTLVAPKSKEQAPTGHYSFAIVFPIEAPRLDRLAEEYSRLEQIMTRH